MYQVNCKYCHSTVLYELDYIIKITDITKTISFHNIQARNSVRGDSKHDSVAEIAINIKNLSHINRTHEYNVQSCRDRLVGKKKRKLSRQL